HSPAAALVSAADGPATPGVPQPVGASQPREPGADDQAPLGVSPTWGGGGGRQMLVQKQPADGDPDRLQDISPRRRSRVSEGTQRTKERNGHDASPRMQQL